MQEIINIYSEEYLKNILLDYNKLDEIYNKSLLSKKGIDKSNVEYQNITKAIDSYMAKMTMTSQLDKEMLNNYKRVFNKTINQDITYLFSNNLLKLPKERLISIMDEETYEHIEANKNKISTSCKQIYQKVMDHKEISKSEEKLLTNYLRDNIGTRDKDIFKMQEGYLRLILNEKTDNEYEETDFVVSFIAREQCKENNIVGLCHLSEFDLRGNPFLDKNNGVATVSRAAINKKFGIKSLNENGENLGKFIHTICHEMRHIEQFNDISNNVCNNNTMSCLYDKIFRNNLSTDSYDYYKKNYFFESGEIDAEIIGYNDAAKYISKYTNMNQSEKDKLLQKKDQKIYKKIVEKRKNAEQKIIDADHFKNIEMNKIVKKNPELLKKYKQLGIIYENDGTMKPFSKMLIESTDFKKKNEKDNNDIYLSSFNVAIDNNELQNVDFSNMSKEEIYKIMHSLSDLYNTYAGQSHNILSAKRKGENMIAGLSNSDEYIYNAISLMASRYKKLESVLDVMYDKFGDDYLKNENYSTDKYIYEKDKKYARYKFSKIGNNSNKTELNEMLNEGNNNILENDNINKK